MSQAVSIERGKIPPQAVDLEEVVLGSLMISEKAMLEIGDILFPDAFYKDAHRNIFKACYDLFKENNPIDLLTVSGKLKEKGKLESVGGDFYIVKLTQKVASSAHIEFHARVILQKYIQRTLIKNSSEIIEKAYGDNTDVFELLDTAYSSLNSIADETIKKTNTDFKDLIDERIQKGRDIYEGKIKPGIPTPIKLLTEKTGGFRGGELIILAARPGMGKTALALMLILYAAQKEYPAMIFSLEMSDKKLTDRIISMEAKVDNSKFNIDGLTRQDEINLEEHANKLKKLPIHIDDTASLSIESFQIKAKVASSKHKIKLIVVDYIQLMKSSGHKGNREQEISKISRGLKMVAMELDIPIIALSQLSRSVETRGGSKRPMLSDLRESGAIEQDADMVKFLFRPEYYGIDEWDDDERGPTKDQCEYIVAKNRNGGLVSGRMKFEGRYTRFSDLESVENKAQADADWFKTEVPLTKPKDAFDPIPASALKKLDEKDDDVPF